jgi:hypothetical protein
MIQTIKGVGPEGMAQFLGELDPFQRSMAQGRSALWSLEQTGRLAARFVHIEVREGIDYIVRCEEHAEGLRNLQQYGATFAPTWCEGGSEHFGGFCYPLTQYL